MLYRLYHCCQYILQYQCLPEVITVDNGPEFVSKVMDDWAYRRGVKLNFILPGKPIENAFA
jgi:putative transposase